MRHCAAMVDIETLSTAPHATIISIGAILFDPFQLNTPEELANGYTFYMNVDPASQPESHICNDTLAWWNRQDPAARLATTADPQPVGVALTALHNFLVWRENQAHPPAHELWANGPNFDCIILESAYSRYSRFKLPVSFRRQLCVRTLKELAWRHTHGRPNFTIGIKHNALDDCIAQALYVQLAHVELGISPH